MINNGELDAIPPTMHKLVKDRFPRGFSGKAVRVTGTVMPSPSRLGWLGWLGWLGCEASRWSGAWSWC
ncbi:hypothetical protein [Streptomyces chattanoogensis]|uniref:hypothetical protein n=1 Tax=Streptomyces chattanoogensis TaxID=66876 RepID=UPI0036A63A93